MTTDPPKMKLFSVPENLQKFVENRERKKT